MKRFIARLRFVLPMLLLGAAPLCAWGDDEVPLEYQIKAACLYNFAKFIDWPDAGSPSADEQFEICIIGKNPFGNFANALNGRDIQGRALHVHELDDSNAGQISKCRIAFVHLDTSHEAALLAAIKNKPIVTVSDNDPATVLRFQMADGKVKFSVNMDAANATGVKMSSQLLKLAVRQ